MKKTSKKSWNLFKWIRQWWKNITKVEPIVKEIDNDSAGSVADKQIIYPTSPAKDEQRDFIAEGGNSQPLKKNT